MPIRSCSLLALAVAGSLAAADGTATPATELGVGGSGVPRSTAGHSWDAPAITIQGQASSLHEDDLIGSYAQPRWTASRLFAEVRTYVIPEGQFDFEYWLFVQRPSKQEKDDAAAAGSPPPKPAIKQQYEAEFGLGHRLQVDLYQVYVKDGSNGINELDATKFEVRYALADWGRLWANPTFYVEWEQAAKGADSAEIKLLLCDQICEGWAWGSNLVFEEKTGDSRDRSHEWNSAVSHTLVDGKCSVGVELAVAYVTALQDDGSGGYLDSRDKHWEIAVGPTIRFHPIPQAHVILTQFVGLNKDAPETKTAMILGWEF